MEIPLDLWESQEDQQRVVDLITLFEADPLILTDSLANVIYLNDLALGLFTDRAGALINRLSFSLLGFGERTDVPQPFVNALTGEGPAWRGMMNIGTDRTPNIRMINASAVAKEDHFVCGVLRLARQEAKLQ